MGWFHSCCKSTLLNIDYWNRADLNHQGIWMFTHIKTSFSIHQNPCFLDEFALFVGTKTKLARAPTHIHAISFSHSVSKVASFFFSFLRDQPWSYKLMCTGAMMVCSSVSHAKAKVFNTYFWLSNENRHFIFLASENLSWTEKILLCYSPLLAIAAEKVWKYLPPLTFKIKNNIWNILKMPYSVLYDLLATKSLSTVVKCGER